MNATELFLKAGDEFKSASVFYCEKCRIVAKTKEQAAKCCAPNVCACGAIVKEQYWTTCEDCRAKAREKKEAETIAAAEKVESWDGPVFWEGYPYNEGYAQDASEMADHFCDEPEAKPEFVFCCHTHTLALTVSDILERETEEWPEGLSDSLKGTGELQAALNAFCELNKSVASWSPNCKKMVRL